MPTYEHKCPKCGTAFDEFQKITSKPGAKCPKCGAKAERQLSTGVGLHFKGSGFYITDYGRAGQAPRKSETESGSAGEKSGSEKPSAEKPSAEKTGGEKTGGEKSSGEKSGGDRSGAEKSGDRKSGGERSGRDRPAKPSKPKDDS